MFRQLILPIILLSFISSCHRGDEPVSCTLSSTPYVYNLGGARLAFPTAFTPNGDGRNDIFHAIGATSLTSYGLAVYDVNGNILFQTTDPYAGWDGTNGSGGGIAPSGYYVVQVQFRTLNGDAVDTHICLALLNNSGGNCIVTNGRSYTFEDQFDPATLNHYYPTTESLCPY